MSHRNVKIGLIGGVGWVSTLEYYRRINMHFERRLGGLQNPAIVVNSLPMESVLRHQESGDSESELEVLAEAANLLEDAGVDFGLICSNTTSKTLAAVQEGTSLIFVDIVDAVIETIQRMDVSIVGLLGTRYVMEGGFYVKRLEGAGVEVRVPSRADRDEVHRVIYEELCVNDIRDESRLRLADVIRRLGAEGCQAVVLGCTELPVLLPTRAVDGVALVDSVEAHLSALYETIGPPLA